NFLIRCAPTSLSHRSIAAIRSFTGSWATIRYFFSMSVYSGRQCSRTSVWMSAGARSSVAALMEGPMNAFHVSTCCSGRRMNFMKFMRRPEQQVLTWKAFIGPSIKAATLDRAPADIQTLVREHWRPEYTDMEKKYRIVAQLPVKDLIAAMDRWDKEVGAQRIKKF